MNKQHLQIGNIVSLNGQIVQVRTVTNRKVGVLTDSESSRLHYARLFEVEPIPITEDWLTKNGFTKLFDGAIPSDYYEVTIDDCEVTISQGGNISNEHWHVHIDNCDRCSIANADILYVPQYFSRLVRYSLHNCSCFREESKLFPSKVELIKSLY